METVRKLAVFLWFVGFSSCQDPYFWQITDVHFDPMYSTKQESCYDPVPNLGAYGNSKCDAPYELIRSSVKAMKDQGPDPEFVLYSGDTQAHPKNYNTTVYNEEFILGLLQNISALISEFFPTSNKVFAIGNHDYNPRNDLPGEQNSHYENLAKTWNLSLGEDGDLANLTYFLKGGFYTQLLAPGKRFRIVVTNTNLYCKPNSVSQGQEYTEKQYTWLEDVLAKAKADGESVHLVAHVPPGTRPLSDLAQSLRDADNTRFNAIIRKYGEVIKGFYSAHDHMDAFRIYYRDGKAVTAMLVAPSVTPRISRGSNYAHNPGVRKIFYDESTGELTDVEQYYLDLEEANKNPGSVQWKKLYSFKDFYDLDGVSAASLDKLVQKFKDNPSSTFEDWYKKRGAGAIDPGLPSCDCKCKTSFICSIENVDYSEFDKCQKEAEEATCGATHFFHFPSAVMLLFSALVSLLL